MKDVDKTYYMVKNDDDDGMTQEEIAKALGVSRPLVSQIERNALMKIRRILRRKNLKKEDLL